MEADAPLWHSYVMETRMNALAAEIQAKCIAAAELRSTYYIGGIDDT